MAKLMDEVVDYIRETRLADLPKETVTYTKKLCASTLGGIAGGVRQPASKIVAGYVQRNGGATDAGVTGHTFRAPVAQAALCNATFLHTTELEDDAFPECVSVGSVFPAALSLGDCLHSSGADVLESLIVGQDLQAKNSLAARSLDRGGNSFGALEGFSFGAWGPAASAAKLLKLDTERTAMAMSISASLINGLKGQVGTMTHLFEMGIGAHNGLLAALMAKDGFTGEADILGCSGGLWDAMGFNPDGLDRLSELLTEEPRIMRIGIKKYGCAYVLQRVIDGAVQLTQDEGISESDVISVEIHVAPWFAETIKYPEPKDVEEARFSVEHVVAAALLKEPVNLYTFTDETLQDPRYVEARKKVAVFVHEDRGFVRFAGTDEIIIKLRDGSEYRKVCEVAKGHPPLYLTDDEVMDKFRSAAEYGGFLSADVVEQVGELVFNLEEVKDVSEIMDLMTFGH